jgi:CheY-like chemotaxis protein
MIVEDSRNDALLFSAALEEAGVTNPLVFTSSYDETVAYFNGAGRYADRELHPLPLLIFMDVQMPKQSGFELLTWLRSNEASSEITVIMMSGSLSQEYPERAYSLGASFYLQKPIAAAELVEALRSVRIHWLELSE